MRARGANLALAPVVDVAREPRWGRIEETYGEDQITCAVKSARRRFIGFSGTSRKLARTRCYDHAEAHDRPRPAGIGTNIGPAEVSERTLREDFFPPFEKLIRETTVGRRHAVV
jgi:beta-glucosidase